MSNEDLPADNAQEDCVHSHPVPADVLRQYSIKSDPDAEKDIADYVLNQARDEEILC